MPRYFFDLYDGGAESRDEEGTELSDLNEARREAIATVSEVAKERFPRGDDLNELSMGVRDGAGTSLFEVALTFSFKWSAKA